MSNSNTWTICFNECGSDSITYVDGRKSIDAVHDAAMKHYNAMKKFKGSKLYQEHCIRFKESNNAQD